MNRYFGILFAALTLCTARVDADTPCCNSCGCGSARYVCRLVCKMKKELTYEYSMDCEKYCHLGPSECCGKKRVCDDGFFGHHWERIWKPTCECKIRDRHVLVKVPVVKEVPVYSCEVYRICSGCQNGCVDNQATQQLNDSGTMPVSVEHPVATLDETLRLVSYEVPAESTVFAAPTVR